MSEGASAATAVLSIRGLCTARDGRPIHKELDLDVIEGETLVLVGGSGSGKTTLLRTLVGLETADGGTCDFEGRDLFQIPEKEWPKVRCRIAYAFQYGALFDSLSVRDNLEFPLREHTKLNKAERAEKVTAQLEALGLGPIETMLPAELSGGMQKRVGVARAIIMDPKVILYDEPTAGLDPGNTRRINQTIQRLKAAGHTSIVVTHDPACAMAVADRFAFLENGKVAATQSREDYDRAPDPKLKDYFAGE